MPFWRLEGNLVEMILLRRGLLRFHPSRGNPSLSSRHPLYVDRASRPPLYVHFAFCPCPQTLQRFHTPVLQTTRSVSLSLQLSLPFHRSQVSYHHVHQTTSFLLCASFS